MTELPPRGWSSPSKSTQTVDAVLLRHGATPLTPHKRFSGSGGTDPTLSPTGRQQAQRAASSPLLREATFADLLCSPLRRCTETADLIAPTLGLPVTIDDDLREMDFGHWEGLTYAQVHQRYPDDLQAWQHSSHVAPTGGSETLHQVLARMGRVAQRLTRRYAGTSILLVTHVTPVKALVAQALEAPASALFRMELSAGSLTRISYTSSDASLRLFNDTSHLQCSEEAVSG